ncbi:MAG TPA: prepilin-type N-terminal cleavage/methylation domain-containing protein [Polyangia bacterium]|nr:prepilin-type N-terminal cleavage/methylation domain-containing protein [Polyangia bacterium]
MSRARRGFSLVEVMVVIAIVGLLLGISVYGFRSVAKTGLRSSAAKLAGAIRYCFDRSVTTGSYFRIVLDLDTNKYWAERSDDRTYLNAGKEDSPGKGQAFDEAAAEKKRDEDEAKIQEMATSVGGQMMTLDPPPKPKRAKFQTFKDTTLPQVKLGRAELFDVFTPRQREPYRKGRAYLYFFPDGHTERAIVRLHDGDDFYSLVVHPLTGRVEVMSGKVDIPHDFGERDEEGKDVTR